MIVLCVGVGCVGVSLVELMKKVSVKLTPPKNHQKHILNLENFSNPNIIIE